jgi:putative endonuclease
MISGSNVARGRLAEAAAASFLEHKGWKILAKNFRCRSAELDLIGLDGETLVFVEVKQRSNRDTGFPEEAVNARKINKLYEAAHFFLKVHVQHAHRDCRFDVIAVEGNEDTSIRHHQNIAGF